MKIKKGDLVQVITGKDKGKQGKVIAALPARRHASWSRVSTGSRSTPRPARPLGFADRWHRHDRGPVHVSNVQLVVEKDGNKVVTRVGYRFDDEGNKIRVAKRTGEDI